MKILLCTSMGKKLKPINNFLKIPLDIVDPRNLNGIDISHYFCAIVTEKTEIAEIPVFDSKAILLNPLTGEVNTILDNSSKKSECKLKNSLYTLLADITGYLDNLTTDISFNMTPVLNEYLEKLAMLCGYLFWKCRQTFVRVNYLPYGYSWGTCISHDVDNLSVKEHGLNSVILKSIAGTFLEIFYGHGSLKNALIYSYDCLKCTLFGSKDPYDNIEKWVELEKNIPSTFYFALEKGLGIDYSREQIIRAINILRKNNFEIGIHGQNPSNENSITKEFEEMQGILDKSPSGIRMHYLRFDKNTWQYLEKAGYLYDTTYGYNKKVGYRSGTVMPYIVPLTLNEQIVEIPLHLMDTTLFNPRYMNLSTESAISLTKNAIEHTKKYRGVLSVLVHQRSVSKYFDRYLSWYLWFRETIIKDPKCWIVKGEDLANWHREWYDLKVDCHQTGKEIQVILNKEMNKSLCLEVLVNLQKKIIEIPAGIKEVKVFID